MFILIPLQDASKQGHSLQIRLNQVRPSLTLNLQQVDEGNTKTANQASSLLQTDASDHRLGRLKCHLEHGILPSHLLER